MNKTKIIANLATYPARIKSLEKIVESILSQVDVLNVYLNEYDEIPEFLDDPRINCVLGKDANGNIKDNGKFYFLDKVPEDSYYFTIDDDIIYPEDYVKRLVSKLVEYDNKVVVGVHGIIFHKSFDSFVWDRTSLLFSEYLQNDITVSTLGTGTICFHRTALDGLLLSDFGSMGMADLWFAVYCKNNGISQLCIRRDHNWIVPVENDLLPENALWEESKIDDREQISIVKEFNLWEVPQESLQMYRLVLEEEIQNNNQTVKKINKIIFDRDSAIKRRDLEITQMKDIIFDRDSAIKRRDLEITQMKESKFWKMRNQYIKVVNKIKYALKSPSSFVKKYTKKILFCIPFERMTQILGYAGLEQNCQIKEMPLFRQRHFVRQFKKMSQDTLVTIIMPAWNREKVIERAIVSIQRQLYKNWQLEIVDDGSTDKTWETILEIAKKDDRIHCHRIKHRGVSAARNFGAHQAMGDIIAYLDSDNTWDEDYLLIMVNVLISSHRKCAYAGIKIIDSNTKETVVNNRIFDLDVLERNNYIDMNIFMHYRTLFAEVGYFDEKLKRWVDWDLILRCAREHPPKQVAASLANYYLDKKNGQITHGEGEVNKFYVINKNNVNWKEEKKTTKDFVTIIIPTYGNSDLTKACIHSIMEYTSDNFHVLVVDNASTDNTHEMLDDLKSQYKKLSFINNYENYGFALGNNIGVTHSSTEYIVLLNNDTIVTQGWIESLIAPLKSDAAVGVVGPKLLYEDGAIQHAGMVFNDKSAIPYHIYQGRDGNDQCVNKKREFQSITGACMAMRRDDYMRLKGFDTLFLNGGEDVDFCLRMNRKLRKKILYEPKAVVYHLESKTEGRGKHILYNRQILADKWGDAIIPDDKKYYTEDGFEVLSYSKNDAEPEGNIAIYRPELSSIDNSDLLVLKNKPKKEFNVGFCTIWHVRGITFHTKQITDALEQGGIKTHIFARWESDRFTDDDPVFHPRVTNAGDNPSSGEIVQWAKQNNIKLLFQMEVHPTDWELMEALKKAGVRIVCYENLDVMRKNEFNEYKVFDIFLFNTFFSRDIFLKKFPSTPSLMIPWGASDEKMVLSESFEAKKQIVLVHVAGWGGMNNRKNTDLIIKAFDKLSAKNLILRLYSQNSIDHFGQEYADIVAQNKRIIVTAGTIENIYDAYAGADILLWPSKREGVGLPILEALGNNLPVIITDGYMMKQWPIKGQHCSICPAQKKKDDKFLPEMHVTVDALVATLSDISNNPQSVCRMKKNVKRDRQNWLWTWQPKVFTEQVQKIIEDELYVPPNDLSYIPKSVLDFECKRMKSYGDSKYV